MRLYEKPSAHSYATLLRNIWVTSRPLDTLGESVANNMSKAAGELGYALEATLTNTKNRTLCWKVIYSTNTQ